MDQQLAFSVNVAAARSGISRSRLYEAIRDGQLIAKKFGRSTIIRDADLEDFLERLPAIEPRVRL